MNKLVLKVVKKQPFNRLWPNCPITKAICEIAGRQVLTMAELKLLDDAGLDVEVE